MQIHIIDSYELQLSKYTQISANLPRQLSGNKSNGKNMNLLILLVIYMQIKGYYGVTFP